MTTIFKWFETRAARSRGAELAAAFMARVPAGAAWSEQKFAAKVKAAVAELQREAGLFQRDQKPNFYQRAQLGNAFKWALKDAGYEPAYVDELTELLMMQLQ